MTGRNAVNNHPKTLKIRTNEQFAKAIENITENKMSIFAAARNHGTPRVTLVTKLMGGTLLNMVDQQNLTKMRNKA